MRAAFPHDNVYMGMRDELGAIYDDQLFASLFPPRGQTEASPWRLALTTVMQFAEGLSDHQAADVCANDQARVARFLVDNGTATHYDYALQALKDIPYNKWREYDPEDTVRFYALHLHELGMIQSSPQKIIAQGTD